MTKSYTIAAAFLEARKTSCYLPKAFADFVDDVTSNLIEIVARLLQYQNNPADIPAYLWRDLREWLRNHG